MNNKITKCPCGEPRRAHPTKTCTGEVHRRTGIWKRRPNRDPAMLRNKTLSVRRVEIEGPLTERSEEAPTTRADCKDGPRPCPWLGCKHHLYLDVNPANGSIKFNFPSLEWDELEQTCSLDVADLGGQGLTVISRWINLTVEAVRQQEVKALAKLQPVAEGFR